MMRHQAIVWLLLQLILELSSCTHIQMIRGSTVQLPCGPPESDFDGAVMSWKFNGKNRSYIVESSGSATVIKNGLYLSISPVTSANEGEYVCLAKGLNVESMRRYNLTVDESFHYAVKVTAGTNVALQCHFPASGQVKANALWFKDTGAGKRTELNIQDDLTDDKKLELLYPNDQDQTIMLRRATMDDAGVYYCETAEGKSLSTVDLIVEAAPALPPPSCKKVDDAWETCQEEHSRTAEPILQESIEEFSMKVYSHLRGIHPFENLLFSPISINGILSHLLLAARNNTRSAIETAVCVPHDFHCIHFQMKRLREKIVQSLQMASQIYYNTELNLSRSFIDQSFEYYEAKPSKLLETSEENTQMINSWVANKTRNKITHLVDSVPTGTQLILLNAVSFSGQWKVKFNEKPKKGLFTKLNGDLVRVPVLYHQKYLATIMYITELKAQVAKFDLTGDSSLYIMLPHSGKAAALEQVEERMTDFAVREMIKQLKAASPQVAEVTLPQIKLDMEPNMNILMKKLGLSSLFEGATLCGLNSEQDVVLDEAKHKAFLALTAQGVEAGAVTSMSFSRSHPSFSALRPFILLLWSEQANLPLFIGRVIEP
ncbi:plasma protease C1 inhibitor isoform X2 [Leuresthes tenuis]|uniref:plasma protease C1 inhibitor isoform X2 n=1 Tax=Leuresthes tenuis TaxID=355514 RepID=UPI003B507288